MEDPEIEIERTYRLSDYPPAYRHFIEHGHAASDKEVASFIEWSMVEPDIAPDEIYQGYDKFMVIDDAPMSKHLIGNANELSYGLRSDKSIVASICLWKSDEPVSDRVSWIIGNAAGYVISPENNNDGREGYDWYVCFARSEDEAAYLAYVEGR